MQTEFGMNTNFYIPKTTSGKVKQQGCYDWAILPWGATEPHNDHLPYCTDVLSSAAIGCDVAARLEKEGIHVMVLPGSGELLLFKDK